MADPARNLSDKPKPVILDEGSSTHMLTGNDDSSAGPVELGFAVNFFGTVFTSLYVNTNGNVTFGEPLYKYLPFRLTTRSPPIIAPFLADVDTRPGASGRVRYGPTTFEGRRALGVNWLDVGYHWKRLDKLNRFQLLLVDRSDLGFGDFDIVMNYDRMVWESGESAGGSEGLGGSAAGAGFSAGTGDITALFEFPGTTDPGALLDSNQTTGLTNTKRNSDILGRHIFRMRGGKLEDPRTPPPQPGNAGRSMKLMPRAVLLDDGRVLVFGDNVPTADVFNPTTNNWEDTGDTTANRRLHTATRLPDGRVLTTGGESEPDTAELYYPREWTDKGVLGVWAAVPNMDKGRVSHTATLLTSGKVLIVGGRETSSSDKRHASAELYDPAGAWTKAGEMSTARSGHTATLVKKKNGQELVLVAGGVDSNNNRLTSTELYDPKAGTWTKTGDMGLDRNGHTATLLQNGRVLVAGGERYNFSDENPKPGSAEVYDPETGTWTATGRMNHPRRNHTALLLRSGHVLVIGGYHEAAGGHQAGIELYDPFTGTWSELDPMSKRREYHAAALLNDNRVLIVGGTSPDPQGQGSYELYSPRLPRK